MIAAEGSSGAQHVGLIVLGACGYMGVNAIQAVKDANEFLSKDGITIDLLCCVDNNLLYSHSDDRWTNILHYCRKTLGYRPMISANLSEVLFKFVHLLAPEGRRNSILLYDATPTGTRFDRLDWLTRNYAQHIAYFGEKPLLVDPNQIAFLKKHRSTYKIFCDFIETQNPVFLQLQRQLRNNPQKIKRLWFWRAGSSGIKKAIAADRNGVGGGALLDKGPHDVALTVSLLGPENIAGFTIRSSEIQYLIAGRYYITEKLRTFLRADNSQSTSVVDDLRSGEWFKYPADGMLSTTIEWHLKDGSSVEANYLFSWLGYLGSKKRSSATAAEKKFVAKLTSLGFREPSARARGWLMTKTEKGPATFGLPGIKENSYLGATHGCEEEQVRIIIAEGAKSSFVGNFLSESRARDSGVRPSDEKPKIDRYLYEVKEGKAEKVSIRNQTRGSYVLVKGRDMGRIVAKVAREVLSEEQDGSSDIGIDALIWVHEAILAAQDAAVKSLRASRKTDKRLFSEASAIIDARVHLLRH